MRRDPLFVAPLNSDFHLSPDSPAIDAGYNAIVAGVLSDFEGDRRIINGRNKPKAIVDLGADEFKP
jgi:hypothetical protein